MKATIIECVFGVLGFGEADELVDNVLFRKNPKKTAEKLEEIRGGRVVDEVVTLIKRLQGKGYNKFMFENPELAQNVKKKLHVKIGVSFPSEAGGLLRERLDDFAVETGFIKKSQELQEWIHNVSMDITKMRVKRAVEKRDLMVVQAIQTIDYLHKTTNTLMSRIREWYGLHFPELDRLINKPETFIRLVLNLGKRGNFVTEMLEKEGIPKNGAKKIAKVAETSMGASLTNTDIEQLKDLCKVILDLRSLHQRLESYVDSTMDEIAPNIRAVAGSLLGARIIALAGDLENMAKKPSSTIQLLGAEKALFRALKTKSKPPKHGIIFQHPLLHKAKPALKGKVARALAGKLAIAARLDAFSGKFLGDQMKAQVENKLRILQKSRKHVLEEMEDD
jgi:nucleolar protein 56